MKPTDEVTICAGKYILGRKIGEGSFGQIYTGVNKYTKKPIAIKLESKKTNKRQQLFYEQSIMKQLKGPGIPTIECFTEEGDYSIMVMELLGPNVESLFEYSDRKFTAKTVLMLAEQMVTRVEWVHLKNYIHRDIKPENFSVGLDKETSTVYILDFGLAKKFRDSKTHQHIPYKENKSLTGTARYASINNHLGIEQSRRDDLEALGNVLIYLAKGKLPWQGVHAKTKEKKHEKILSKKMGTPIEYLCDNSIPELATYMHYCRMLKFEDRPDYVFLKRLFTERMEKEGIEFDLLYDWVDLDGKRLESVTNKSLTRSVKSRHEEYKRQPSMFRSQLEETIKEVDNENKEEEGQENTQEQKEEEVKVEEEQDEKDNAKKKIDDVFKQLQEIGKTDQMDIIGPTLRDKFNALCTFTS